MTNTIDFLNTYHDEIEFEHSWNIHIYMRRLCTLITIPEMLLYKKHIFTNNCAKTLKMIIEKFVLECDYYSESDYDFEDYYDNHKRLNILDDILHIRNVLEKHDIYIFSEPFDFDPMEYHIKIHNDPIKKIKEKMQNDPDFDLNQNKKESYLFTVAKLIEKKNKDDGVLIEDYYFSLIFEEDRFGNHSTESEEIKYYNKNKDPMYEIYTKLFDFLYLNGAKFLKKEEYQIKNKTLRNRIGRLKKYKNKMLARRKKAIESACEKLNTTKNIYDHKVVDIINDILPYGF